MSANPGGVGWRWSVLVEVWKDPPESSSVDAIWLRFAGFPVAHASLVSLHHIAHVLLVHPFVPAELSQFVAIYHGITSHARRF